MSQFLELHSPAIRNIVQDEKKLINRALHPLYGKRQWFIMSWMLSIDISPAALLIDGHSDASFFSKAKPSRNSISMRHLKFIYALCGYG